MKHSFKAILSAAAITIATLPTLGQGRLPQTAPVPTKKEPVMPPAYAWRIQPPLAEREDVPVDTIYENYSLEFVPATITPAWVTTGNYGCPAENLIFFNRPSASNFFFRDAIAHWIPSTEKMKFYNSHIPMTLVGYNFGGGKETGQDHLSVDFSGNINKRAQVGALLDYIYSKGSYNYQAMKDLTWGFSGSYIGERYQFQGFYYHYNLLNKENGGIADDLYITDPAEIQGGSTSVNYKTIPTNLEASHNRTVGGHLYLANRYSIGFMKDVEIMADEEGEEVPTDSVVQQFVPVTSFSWILDYNNGRHTFLNSNTAEDADFWTNRYLSLDGTNDKSSYWSLRNTVGVSLLEGFNKYAKAGLSVFLTHEYRKFKQPVDSIDHTLPDSELTPLPFETSPTGESQNLLWVGAQLTRHQGRILNYEATGEIGFVGEAAGEIKLNGRVSTNIPLLGDTVSITGYGDFSNLSVPYFLQHYISNHFAWNNDFGKTRRLRFGGRLNIPHTGTSIDVGAENLQNYVYFNSEALPTQATGSVQVFSATLHQNFRYRAWNWENSVVYQTSTDEDVIPIPKLAIHSNMYLKFKIATLHVQIGLDCDYYTRYRAVNYQPATMVFYNQSEALCGNYPYMNAYINMKLSRTRFYVMMSHVNQGLFGDNNFFSMPHYPLNPRRLQMGLSVDFAN